MCERRHIVCETLQVCEALQCVWNVTMCVRRYKVCDALQCVWDITMCVRRYNLCEMLHCLLNVTAFVTVCAWYTTKYVRHYRMLQCVFVCVRETLLSAWDVRMFVRRYNFARRYIVCETLPFVWNVTMCGLLGMRHAHALCNTYQVHIYIDWCIRNLIQWFSNVLYF